MIFCIRGHADRLHYVKSRRYLEDDILPWINQYPPVMDVGVRDYVETYRHRIQQYVSVDRDATRKADILADVTTDEFVEQALSRYNYYGSILFNGVIGFGISSKAHIWASVGNFAKLLASGGHLVIGWNEGAIGREPLSLILLKHDFEQEREPIELEKTHTYMFWRRK